MISRLAYMELKAEQLEDVGIARGKLCIRFPAPAKKDTFLDKKCSFFIPVCGLQYD